MAELVSLQNISTSSKIKLLNELGYDSDGEHIYAKTGQLVIDKYIDEAVTVQNMLILPGSTIILDDNPLSIASYLEEYGDLF
jgi:hypothetical protein